MQTKVFRAALLGLAVCGAAWAGGRPARAGFVFDPDGGGPAGSLTINGFVPAANSAFGNGELTAVRNVVPGGVGNDIAIDQFVLTYQTNLTGFLPASAVDPNLNVTHQITVTLQMREYVQAVSPDGKAFTLAVSSNQAGMAGLQMWANSGPPTFDGSGLNGRQYKPASAVLILTAGAASSSAGNFAIASSPGSSVLLDQAPGAIEWGNQQSVSGSGVTVVNFNTTSVNTAYFPSGPTSVSPLTLAFTSAAVPFRSINPAQTMWDGTATQPLIGTVNGDPAGRGTGVLLEVSGSIVAAAVPEPSSVCLLALGLGGVLVMARRKRLPTA
jgi:hypothetical protein